MCHKCNNTGQYFVRDHITEELAEVHCDCSFGKVRAKVADAQLVGHLQRLSALGVSPRQALATVRW